VRQPNNKLETQLITPNEILYPAPWGQHNLHHCTKNPRLDLVVSIWIRA
jgi:hypothetical protein